MTIPVPSRLPRFALSLCIAGLFAVSAAAAPASQAAAKAQAAKPAAQAAKRPAPATPPASPPNKSASDDDKVPAAFSSPLLVWKMDSKKDPLTDEVSGQPTSTKFFLTPSAFMVSASASCNNNGVSVFFVTSAGTNVEAPHFAWYTDQSDNSGEQIADVRLRVDTRDVHVAQGYPNKEGDTLYANTLGLLFYAPNLVSRVTREQEDNANTGFLALDGLIAPIVKEQARANAQGYAANSAGPLSDIVSANSIRVELPLLNMTHPVVDLNPQDKVLHKFVEDCNARFSGGNSRPSSPPPAASTPAPGGRRITR